MAETISPAPAPRRRRLWLRILVGVFGVLVVLLVVGYFVTTRSEEHTSELQSRLHLVCRLLLQYRRRDGARRHSSRAGRRRATAGGARSRRARPRPPHARIKHTASRTPSLASALPRPPCRARAT